MLLVSQIGIGYAKGLSSQCLAFRISQERRTEILHKLEKSSATAKGLSGEISVTYSTILHHLHNLEDRGIIERVSTNPPFTWKAKPVGQQRLIQ
jgi:predicted ArsR family transcriptional regulator